jgi:hypothetical protein
LADDLRKALNDIDKYSLKEVISPLDELSKRMQEITSPIEKVMAAYKNPLEGIDARLGAMRMPAIDDFRMPKLPPMKSMWQVQAELFMEGLQQQVQDLERGLKSDEELLMTCWHGHEKLQVLSISMPSKNVVALRCMDADGNQVQVTGHMHSVTFSFMVRKAQPPTKRNKIGFSMLDYDSENGSE